MVTCSQAAAEEPLTGTADKVDVWLMLEYNRPWRAKATKDNNLPGSVKARLASEIEKLERDHGLKARLQFIAQDRKYRGDSLTFFVGVNDHDSPKLFKNSFVHYDDLEDLNLAEFLSDGAPVERQTEPAYFVCTNGRRDQCCAVYGTPLYLMLAREVGSAAWKTTHIGGHRFAGNILTLPNGATYGRVSRHAVGALVEATNAGALVLDNLRGRTCFEPYEQVAEHLARSRAGSSSIKEIQWAGTEGDGPYQVMFENVASGESQSIQITRSDTPQDVLGSCGDEKPKQVWTYAEA